MKWNGIKGGVTAVVTRMTKHALKSPLRACLGGSVLSCLSFMASWSHGAGLLTPVGEASPLQMASHIVDVEIQDGFVVTRVDQVFRNPGTYTTDAHYRFPLPSNASVGQFTYWVMGQAIHGEVVEKPLAQRIYQQEKAQGRKVALSEQQGYQHFDMRVANIQPGEDVRLQLVYLQPVEMDHGVGRYVYPLEDGATDEVQRSFWTMDEQVREQFQFNGRIRSGYPVDAVRVASHAEAQVQQISAQEWQLTLGAVLNTGIDVQQEDSTLKPLIQFDEGSKGQTEGAATAPANMQLNRDVVFYWRLQPGAPGGLDVVAQKPSALERGTFMMTLTPADDLSKIQRGTDWTLVLDISGSMQGKFATLLEGVRRGVNKFNPQDRVRVILFNGRARNLTRGYVQATPDNMATLVTQLEGIQPDGSTDLMDAVKMALTDIDADRTSAIWLVTDGVANVGETHQRAFIKLLKKKDIRLFTFIMGNGANRPLLKGLSKASNGFAIEVSNSDDMLGQLEKAASKVSHAAMHDIQVTFNGLKVSDVEPQTIGSLYRGQQLHLFGHYWKAGKGEVVVKAKVSGQKIEYRIPVVLPDVSTDYPELERMRAFAQIQRLMDEQEQFGEDADRKEAIIDLAKDASLVTAYTSMIVLEEEQFERHGIQRNNAKRIEAEEQARSKRSQGPVSQNNQANHHPTLAQPRAHLGGGVAIDPWWMVLVILVLASRKRMSKLMS